MTFFLPASPTENRTTSLLFSVDFPQNICALCAPRFFVSFLKISLAGDQIPSHQLNSFSKEVRIQLGGHRFPKSVVRSGKKQGLPRCIGPPLSEEFRGKKRVFFGFLFKFSRQNQTFSSTQFVLRLRVKQSLSRNGLLFFVL